MSTRSLSTGLLFIVIYGMGCKGEKGESDSAVVVDEPIDWSEQCHDDLTDWRHDWKNWESRLLDELNDARSQPASCGTMGAFDAAPPLEMNDRLRCASRYHSLWMGDNDMFQHESPGGDLGEGPFDRMAAAQFEGIARGENVGSGYDRPEDMRAGWMSSDGHCANIMDPQANVAGIGYYWTSATGLQHYWTLNTGAEPAEAQ